MTDNKQFPPESILVNAWLGFSEYPVNAQNPKSYNPPIAKCQVICSTATDYSKKVGWLGNRKHRTHWFAKIVESQINAQIELQGGKSKIPLSATLQLNPSSYEGITVGPFTSLEDIRVWSGL